MKIRPLHDRLIVKRLEEERKTASGIVIPDTAAEKPDQGEVKAIGKGKVAALIHASDAAEDGCRKLDGKFRAGARGETPAPVRVFSADELGLASGKTNVIHAALIQGGAAAKFLASASRAERYRKGSAAAFAEPIGSDTDKE